MLPRTKFQKQISNLSPELAPVGDKQKAWAIKNCFDHFAHIYKDGMATCLECGYNWSMPDRKPTNTHCTCPNCHIHLKIDTSRKRIFNDYNYWGILTTHKKLQVLRFFYIKAHQKVGTKADYVFTEVVQRWIAPDGTNAVMARLRPIYGFYDTWNFSSKMEIRPNRPGYNIFPYHIYPTKQTIPEIKKRGFKTSFHDMNPTNLFCALLTNNKAETLFKTGEMKLLKYFLNDDIDCLDEYWPSIRVCLRNRYTISDASIWRDYIDLLTYFHKDIHNPKFICPANLAAEHDQWSEKKSKIYEAELIKIKLRADQEYEKIKAEKRRTEEAKYKELKEKFFGLKFSDALINVHVLESAAEFKEEGEAMNHCVYSREYHLRPNSLILSARIGDERVETVEVSLNTFSILQSQGFKNQDTKYHNNIIQLVNKNMPLIRQRMAA